MLKKHNCKSYRKDLLTAGPCKEPVEYQTVRTLVVTKGGEVVIRTDRQPVFYGKGQILVYKVTKIDHRNDDILDFEYLENKGPFEYEITIKARCCLEIKTQNIHLGMCRVTINMINEKDLEKN